jgi:DNA-binding beta-propeller fold protein YncE
MKSTHCWRALALVFMFLLGAECAQAQQGLPSQTWPAGTHLSTWNAGGRITTFHRGRLLLGGLEGQGTWVYDISNPLSPQQLQHDPNAVNGHAWQKVGDLFYRQYWNPEQGYNADTPQGVSQFVSLANPLNRTRWTQPIHNFPVQTRVWGGGFMDTYPYWFYTQVVDARVGWWPPVSSVNVDAASGVSARNRFRIGNLLFYTPGDDQNGVAVFDIGNPAAPVLLDRISTGVRQYTTAWQVYRHYLVLMIGDNSNGPAGNANTLIIDFSDPTDLRIDQTLTYDQLPGRYVHFQDRYAFAGRGDRGVKFDMETRSLVREFRRNNTFFGDFQWIPLGHLLLVSTSETNASQSHLFTHQDGLDTTPPTVGYHLPRPNALNQPVNTAVGLVIHERLDSTTVNEQNIQLRTVGGAALPGIVMHTSYDVVHFYPVDPLQPNTTYELSIGGVRDVAGNAMAPYSFRFSTGSTIVGGAPELTALTHSPTSPVNTGASVQFTATASAASGSLEYRWDFGDGTPQTAWSSSNTRSHSFSTPGVHTVQVQARNGSGEIASRTVTLVARNGSGQARNSSSILRHPSRSEVWVVNPDHGTVAVHNASSAARLAEITVGAHPLSLAAAANGHVWVANREADSLMRIDPVSRSVVQTVALGYGAQPVAVLTNAAGSTGYVVLSGPGRVRAFDASNGSLGSSLDVGAQPEALALAADGSALYVSRMISAQQQGELRRIALPAFSAATVVALPLDSSTPDSGTAARGVPNYVGALALSSDGGQLWYGGKKDNVLRGRFREGTDLSFETSMRALIGRVGTAAGTEQIAQRLDIDNSGRVSALLLAPGDSHLFVALESNNRVLAIDPWDRSILAEADVGFAPQGLALDAASGRLYVRNFLSRSLSVFDVSALLASGADQITPQADAATSASEPLTTQVLAGKRHFYDASDARMGQDGYFSCAMCHLDGRQDGRVWDFTQLGEGLRNTTSLRGGAGMGNGLVHWSGNFDEIQDFEIPIRNLFGGLGFMDDAVYNSGNRAPALGAPKAGHSAALDALAAYVASLNQYDRSPHRNTDGSLTAAGAAGRTVFQNLGCARCHAGNGFTDSAQRRRHDVGTLGPGSGQRLGGPLLGLDTPSLRGAFGGAPYLHDGRAETLEAVFQQHNSSGRHGATASLSTQEFNNLMAYLRQIDGSEPAMPNPPQLALSSPTPGASFAPGSSMTLSISSDLPQISRVDYRVGGAIVASATSAPFSASWTVAGLTSEAEVVAEVQHGPYRSLSAPVRVVAGVAGAVFADGFED